MLDRYFTIIYDFVTHRKKLFLGLIVILTAAATMGLGMLDFDSGIEMMLPDEDNIHRTINFLRNSNLSDKIIVSLALKSDDRGKEDLFRAAEQLEESLQPPLFTNILSGASGAGIMDETLFLNYFPLIATQRDLLLIEDMLNNEYVSERMREIYRQLLRPQSIFTASMFYSDPLGINLMFLDKLKIQSESTGYRVGMENGHFISVDGRHTMVIANTPVPITDSSGSSNLIETLRGKIGKLPAYVSAGIVSGHLHTLSNEKVIKEDIRLTIGIAAAAFLLLFFVVFRDIRAVLVFLIPAASVILSMNISSLLIGSLSYWVAGLGTVMAGISIDYGIHIFVAVRNSGNASHVIKNVARPISLGAVTTMGIFAAFFFSDIQGYHQLALFSIISIGLSLVCALFILPHFLSKGEWIVMRGTGTGKAHTGSNAQSGLIVLSWAVLLVAALVLSFKVSFDSDVVKLDGSEPAVLEAEESFKKTWGGQDDQGIFVVSGDSREKALEINDLIFNEMERSPVKADFTSLSSLWPSQKTKSENALRWNEFWKNGKEASLKNLLKEESVKYQLRDSAFSTFFKNLYVDMPINGETDGEFMAALKERFVQKKPEEYQILSFFPDNNEYVESMRDLSSRYPGTFVVSRRTLSQSISGALTSEMKLFAVLATIFIVLLTFLFLRNIVKSLLALVPVITSVLLVLGFMSLSGHSLNIASLIAGIVAMGLCIDYGIFMTYEYKHELKRSAVLAVTISAVTTLIGAGVLLFAHHPALFSIGITLVIGVSAGYLSSVLVIPSIEKLVAGSALTQ